MDKRIRKPAAAHELERISLGELIRQHVRLAIETAVHEELRAALGTNPYERTEVRRGYRNGTKVRTLTGPTGPAALSRPSRIAVCYARHPTVPGVVPLAQAQGLEPCSARFGVSPAPCATCIKTKTPGPSQGRASRYLLGSRDAPTSAASP